jgi:hypothetical protein
MHYFLLFLAMACTPDYADVHPPGDVESLLSSNVEDIAERARPLAATRARLTPDGDPLDGDLWSIPGWRAYPVVDAADAVGILWQDIDIDLVLWIDRVDLPISPVEASWMGGSQLGIRLPAGTAVDPLESAGSQVRVRAVGQDVELDAWVDRYRLDNWWYDEEAGPVDTTDAVDPVRIRGGTEIFDAPSGKTLGRVQSDASLQGWVAEDHGSYRRVRFVDDGWQGNVWIHEDDLDAHTLIGGRGWAAGASSHCGGLLYDPAPNVRQGALLLAGPGGSVVGVITGDTYLSLSGDPGGWQESIVDTAFGEAPVWISPDDLLDARPQGG